MKLISFLVISLALVTAATAISYSDLVIAQQGDAAVSMYGIAEDGDENWLRCAVGVPTVSIVKHRTEDKFRVLIVCSLGDPT
jgi:hypothetical protein